MAYRREADTTDRPTEGSNDCIDGLVLPDLNETDPKVLKRYMGKVGAKQFLERLELRNIA